MLRPASLRDLERVATWIHTADECRLWAGTRVQFPLRLAALAVSIDFSQQPGFVLKAGPDIVGFGQIVPKAGGRAHLARLIVSPTHRRQGLGATLVRGLLDRARVDGHAVGSLNVDPANETAIRLYERLGFKKASRPIDEPDPYGSIYMDLRL